MRMGNIRVHFVEEGCFGPGNDTFGRFARRVSELPLTTTGPKCLQPDGLSSLKIRLVTRNFDFKRVLTERYVHQILYMVSPNPAGQLSGGLQ